MYVSVRTWALPILLGALLLTACAGNVQTSVVVRPGSTGASSARLIVEPDDGVQPVVDFIHGATRSLDVAMYLLSDRDVVSALEASRKRGVVVRVMLEENPFGTGPGNRAVFSRLTAAGVAARWSPARFRFNHEKYAISDGKVALVGTANWTLSAFTANREYLAVESDPAEVRQLVALFDADWNGQPGQAASSNLVVSPTDSRADFYALFGAAKQTLDLESEEMEDTGIADGLIAAAHRGVQVRAIFPVASGASDPNVAGERALVDGGVLVRHLANPYVHGKEVVVDRREAFVGSENFSKSSLDENREVGLLIEDPVAVQRIGSTFERDWQSGRP